MPLDGITYNGIEQDEVRALLWRAKQIIRRNGWCQNTSRDEEGRYCIYAAMRAAGSWPNWTQLRLPWPAEWQDDPGRTVEDVYAWFDHEIAKRTTD